MDHTNENSPSMTHGWEVSPEEGPVPFQLRDFIRKVFEPLKLEITDSARDAENLEYGGSSLKVAGKKILFRVAKTTPAKAGQFTALYKRSEHSGKIIPIDVSDDYDYAFIASFDKHCHGVFIFDRDILIKKGIYSKDDKGGKLSFRVYAPWAGTVSPQAKQTQKWQCQYFLSLDADPLSAFENLFPGAKRPG